MKEPPPLPLICRRIGCRRWRQRIEACGGHGGCPYRAKREEYELARAVPVERREASV